MSKKIKISEDNPIVKGKPLAKMTFEVPVSLKKAFKLKAAQEERSIKDIMRELMESYIKNNENN
jgi:hypothetical protein